jgi:hypothetical protein
MPPPIFACVPSYMTSIHRDSQSWADLPPTRQKPQLPLAGLSKKKIPPPIGPSVASLESDGSIFALWVSQNSSKAVGTGKPSLLPDHRMPACLTGSVGTRISTNVPAWHQRRCRTKQYRDKPDADTSCYSCRFNIC